MAGALGIAGRRRAEGDEDQSFEIVECAPPLLDVVLQEQVKLESAERDLEQRGEAVRRQRELGCQRSERRGDAFAEQREDLPLELDETAANGAALQAGAPHFEREREL